MLNIKTPIGLAGARFAEKITDKYTAFTRRRLKSSRGLFGFFNKLSLIYAFPFLLIKRNTFFLKKLSVLPTKNAFTSANTSFENELSINQNYISLLNKPSIFTFTTWNRLAVESERPLRDETTSYKQETATSSICETLQELTLPPQMLVPQFLSGPSASTILQSTREKTDLSLAFFPKPSVVENQIKQLSETILQRNQRMLLLQQKPVQYSNQRLLHFLAMNPNIHLAKNEEILLHITAGHSRVPVNEYAPSEHVVQAYPQIIRETKEKIVEKQKVSTQPVIPIALDMNHLADQLYQLIERKIRIEKERRGL